MALPAFLLLGHFKNIPLTILSCTLLASLCNAAYAADNTPSYPDLLLDDVKTVLTAPARWQAEDWKNIGWASLAVIGVGAVVDAPLRDEMRRQPTHNDFMLTIQRFGAEYSIGVVGGFFLAGSLTDNDTALSVAQDTLSASIIASGLITPAIKIIAGRSRPYENMGTTDFKTLSASSPNSSFPSGHTTEAFALASVISAHYEASWIKNSAYTVATMVGLARIYNDAHFASDVLAGALIGNWVGQSVVTHNQAKRPGKLLVIPESSLDLIGIRLAGNF